MIMVRFLCTGFQPNSFKNQVLIDKRFSFLNFSASLDTLESFCCKKSPNQEIGHGRFSEWYQVDPKWLRSSLMLHSGPIWYHSEPSDVPYSQNLPWPISWFGLFLQQNDSRKCRWICRLRSFLNLDSTVLLEVHVLQEGHKNWSL